jgi:hypothetical protein
MWTWTFCTGSPVRPTCTEIQDAIEATYYADLHLAHLEEALRARDAAGVAEHQAWEAERRGELTVTSDKALAPPLARRQPRTR